MKLNIFKSIFPKKSILKKNKWLLLAIVVLVCLGLYFYSIKNKENFETTVPEFKQIFKELGIQRKLDDYGIKLSDDFIIEEKEQLSSRFNLRLINKITEIKDRIKDKCVINGVDDTPITMDYSRFKINDKDTFKLNCASDSSGETNLETKVNTLLETLERRQKELLVTEPIFNFVSGVRLETINIYLAEGCTHSDVFKRDILPGLTKKIKVYYPSISVGNNTCETHTGDTKTNNQDVIAVCKLAGYYKSTPRDSWDKPRVFPTIEYSSVIEISKAVDKSIKGKNIVTKEENEEYMTLVGKYASVRYSEKRTGEEWKGQEDVYWKKAEIEWYDPVTNRFLLNDIRDVLDNGRLKLIKFVDLNDAEFVSNWQIWDAFRSIDIETIEKTKEKNKEKTTSSSQIPIGTIIEVYDNDDTNNWYEYEVYWYNEGTRLSLIVNKSGETEKWEYVSMGDIEWRFKTEVVNNYYYKNQFDPKKKLDKETKNFIDEDNGKIEYSESKIFDWLLTIR